MKQKCAVVFVLLTLLIPSGCNRISSDTGNPLTIPSKTTVNPLGKNEIKWITMTGGLGGITAKVLFNGADDASIDKIIEMFNENTEMQELQPSSTEYIISKVRPIGIVISLNNDNKLYLWPFYKEIHYANGNGTTFTALNDRFILQMDKDGTVHYYEVLSKNIADYLLDGWKEDMPVVCDVIINSDAFSPDNPKNILKEGDKFTVSGDGCTSSVVGIYLVYEETGQRWLIGRAEPVYGAWEWNAAVNKRINTAEGNEIQLSDGIYDIIVDLGDREKTAGGIIIIGENPD